MATSIRVATSLVACTLAAAPAWSQALAGPEKARPVTGDPGISSMLVLDRPEFRILRDYAEPGATRRVHAHADAVYHVFVLITGKLRLTVESEAPVEVNPGEALYLKGGANHTFTNIGPVAATIVEVFGKAEARPGDLAALAGLAPAFGAPPKRLP